ncbi:MAG TPA: DAK2 domain-containing protein [Kineosporiaceae bacterium]|nr:DAK2 domain-containing protein [Kineosporiaceae bacterium]
MLEVLDGRGARLWATAALTALGEAREELDALNVFPVPDGDTGTNLYLTFEAAYGAVTALPAEEGLRTVIDTFARGALLGARGNSGIILAQLMRGWADVLAKEEVMDGAAAKRAMALADAQAWAAVAVPVEGTILSVSRASAEAAAKVPGDRLLDVVQAGILAAREALARTPEQLPVLRRAGVVDAGGAGLLLLLETLGDLLEGRYRRRPGGLRRPALPAVDLTECDDLDPEGPAYEVMYLLDAPDVRIPALRAALAPLGDSLVVVGGGGLWHVHVHVDDPGAAVEAGIEAGRPRRVRVSHFAEQIVRRSARRPTGVGLVACAAGPGLARLFEQAGAVAVRNPPGRRPSTGEILSAVRRTGAAAVVVLPNDGATMAVAGAAAAAAREEGVHVTVLPTRAQVQGLAAAAVHDPARPADVDVVQMSAAAGAARDGAVTVAVRDAITTAGPCRAGDVLGVVQGDFVVVGTDLAAVAVEVVDRLLTTGGELVTVVRGHDADDALVRSVTEHLRRTRRDVEVNVLDGDQERYHLLLGVE